MVKLQNIDIFPGWLAVTKQQLQIVFMALLIGITIWKDSLETYLHFKTFVPRILHHL